MHESIRSPDLLFIFQLVSFIWLGKSHLLILSGEMSLGHWGGGGGGGLRVAVSLFNVSVKMEIIDFLQRRVKQKL